MKERHSTTATIQTLWNGARQVKDILGTLPLPGERREMALRKGGFI